MSSMAPQSVVKSLQVVGEIFQEENIRICVKESFKGGLITGIAALVGGLLGGKSGLVAGIVKAFINYNLFQLLISYNIILYQHLVII